MLAKLLTENQCRDKTDTCTLCCKLFGIDEPDIKKPVNVWCPHCQKGTGCAIYDNRYDICRTYRCMWRKGDLPAALKPSKCKIIFDMNASNNILVATVDPAFRGAERAAPVQQIMQEFSRRGVVVMVNYLNQAYIFGHEKDDAVLRRVLAAVNVDNKGV